MAMDLHPTLGDILDDFLYCEIVRVCHQTAELASAMKLHQARMKDVCYSLKRIIFGRPLSFPSLTSPSHAGVVGKLSPQSSICTGIRAFAI